MKTEITNADLEELQYAKYVLENPGIAAKITNYLGSPVEKGFELLPADWKDKVGTITQKSLLKATDVAIFTMRDDKKLKPTNTLHKLGVAASGGIGGFFGFAALAIELPISTTIMLRSIADIARAQGELISDYETKLACLEVFAHGGNTSSDEATESGYFTTRAFLSKSLSEAIEHFSVKATSTKSAPGLIRFISTISQRFGIQITEKVAAQALPFIGAAGGAFINTVFIDHFQDMATGHFIVRKLERKYGKPYVEAAYNLLPKN